MKKITIDDPESKSADLFAANVEQLKSFFPEAFTDGKIDFEVLKALLGGAVDERPEKYGLNWHGRRRAPDRTHAFHRHAPSPPGRKRRLG